METKFTRPGPMASNRKKSQGSAWIVVPAEEDDAAYNNRKNVPS
jgi:hypothetical protein